MDKSIYSHEYECLRQLLRQIRLESGQTQADLARNLGTLQSIVSNIESGERRIDLVELCWICDALGVSLGAFVEQFERLSGRGTTG